MNNNLIDGNEEIFANAFAKQEYRNGQLCINLTKMAKPFGKRVNDFFALQSTKDFIANLLIINTTENDGNIDNQQVTLYESKSGLMDGGTWSYNNLLTIEFARWLSVPFAIWCNQKIETLMREGQVSLSDMPTPNSSKKDWILYCLKQEEENEKLQLENQEQKKQIEENAPKVEFAEDILCSEGTILVGEFAKVLTKNGFVIGQNRLFKWFVSNGYMSGNENFYHQPYQKFVEQGLFQIKQTTWTHPNGTKHLATTTVITAKGQQYFLNKFKEQNNK